VKAPPAPRAPQDLRVLIVLKVLQDRKVNQALQALQVAIVIVTVAVNAASLEDGLPQVTFVRVSLSETFMQLWMLLFGRLIMVLYPSVKSHQESQPT